MISLPTNSSFRSKRPAGFTLAEVLIAAGIGSIIMLGVLSVFIHLVKTGVRTGHYSGMEAQTRLAFEQLGIDARMSNKIISNFTSGAITSFTLTIPNSDLSAEAQYTYVYDTSNPQNKKLVLVPGNNPAGTTGRRTLITNIKNLTFLRYNSSSVLIPTSTVSDDTVKHIQISISVSRAGSGVVEASQVIRSSAFTLRNI